jgi:hypothetical protein
MYARFLQNRVDSPLFKLARARHLQLALFIVLYLLVWLVFNQWHSVPFASIETDGFEQLAQAQTVFTRQFERNVIHPEGYALGIWLVARFFHDWFLSAKVVSGISGLVFLLAVLKLAQTVFDSKVAFLTALIVLANFFFVAYTNLVQSDMLGAALGQLGIYLLVTSTPNRMGRAFASGLVFGIAGYVRIVYLPLGALALVVAFLDFWRKQLPVLKRAGAILIGLGIGIAPLLILNYVWFGRFWVDENFRNAAAYIYGFGFWDKFNSLLEVVLYNPPVFFVTFLRRLLFDQPLLLGHVVGYALFFGFVGWMLALTRDRTSPQWHGRLLWGFGVCLYSLTLPMGSSELRYFIFLVPFILAGSVYLVEQLFGLESAVGIFAIIALLFSNLSLYLPNFSILQAERAPEFVAAANIVKESADAETVTLVSQPQVGHFTEYKYIDYRNVAQEENLTKLVEEYGLKYLIIDERYGVGHYKLFARLIEPSTAAAEYSWLKLRYFRQESPRIVVYEVVRSAQ